MRQSTLDRIRKCLAEVLAIEPETIAAQSRLVDDLGADSLDLVELMYLMEQEFNLRLSKKDMSLSAQLGIPEEQIHENEMLTPKALGLLRQRFPHAVDQLVEGTTRNQLASLLTVDEIVKVIEERLHEKHHTKNNR